MFAHGESIYNSNSDNYWQLLKEHQRLTTFLNDLQNNCINLHNQLHCDTCNREMLASCRGHLPSYFHDLIDLCSIHFYREEVLIEEELKGLPAHNKLRNHHLAHALILKKIGSVIAQCALINETEQTDEAYRLLYKNLARIFEEHDAEFDNELTQCINEKHARLKSAQAS
jgi:hemerythrin